MWSSHVKGFEFVVDSASPFLRTLLSVFLQDIYLPLHVQESEDFAVDIFGFPLAIFTKVIFIFSCIS